MMQPTIPHHIDDERGDCLRTEAVRCGQDIFKEMTVYIVTALDGSDPTIFVNSQDTGAAPGDDAVLEIDNPDNAERLAGALTQAASDLRRMQKETTK